MLPFVPKNWNYKCTSYLTFFFFKYGFWGLNLGPHVCKARTLSNEQCPNTLSHHVWSEDHVTPTRPSQLPLGASCCSWLPFCLSVGVFAAGPLTIVVPASQSSLDRVELCAENSIKRRQSPYTLTLTVRLGMIWSHELPSWTSPPCPSELGWDNVSAICQQRTLDMQIKGSV